VRAHGCLSLMSPLPRWHEPQLLDFSTIIIELNNAVDQFTFRGSVYVITCITKLTAVIVPFNPLGVEGSSYIPTPQ